MYLSVALPSAPGTPEVSDVRKNSCVLKWEPSEKDGGTPIIGYTVDRRTGTSPRWLPITKRPTLDTIYEVPDLVEGTQYEFRVTAENKVGKSDPSKPSKPITAKDPWGE